MKVLITGGYGFIGSFVAETFHKEGHKVFIIDNLTTGNKENVQFKHKFYNLEVEDPKCEEVFKANRFDVVIHLAAQVDVGTSMDDPFVDSKANVLGLANILQLSQKYGTEKVVFASSAAVYGLNEEIPLKEESTCDPISLYGINKWIGELYCKKWEEVYGLSTLCFRFSNVYGPKQGTAGEGGVISIFTNRVLQQKDVIVYGDGEQTRDFIYVQDVANAILRGVESNLSGIYNLSTNQEVSINELINSLSKMGKVQNVIYDDPKPGDIKNSRLRNSKIKQDLDWVPLHSLEEGLEKTFQWFKNNSTDKFDLLLNKKRKRRISFTPMIPYLENFVILAIIYLLSIYIYDYLLMIDYPLLYIVITSFILGRNQSILSIGLASTWFLYENIMNGRELISLLVDHNTLVHIGIYIFVGLTIGYLIDKKDKRIIQLRSDVDGSDERYKHLQTIFNDTLTVKNELQNQLLYTNDSFGAVYQVMKHLDSLEPTKIYHGSIKIVEEIMKEKAVAFYIIDRSHKHLRLVAQSEGLDRNPLLAMTNNASLIQTINKNQIYVNKKLDDQQPYLSAPIMVQENAIGVIQVYRTNFEQLTLFNLNKMTVISKLISSALHCAYQHQDKITREQQSSQALKKDNAYV
ncbi:NAD-dependent epimerase/dehydratase family protein [Ornithinibacillus salinisoli]|uniref:NAD-dependent epimerase/dehydratase family protein n=1 Tax=Ornithinibacillus salinisoli TaxID=1848459 RepID=A0ABW4VW91_9BACI